MKSILKYLIALGCVSADGWAASTPAVTYENRGSSVYAQPLPSIPVRGSWVSRPGAVRGTEVPPIFVNPGNTQTTNPPQINATAFLNLGTFTVVSPLSYDFQNTRFFTNRGTMLASPGFRFDYTDDFGIRRPAYNFINEGPGQISGVDAGFNQYQGYSNLFFQTMMHVRATNLVNAGYMSVGNNGTLRLEGQNVNLTRGGLEVESIRGSVNANIYFELTDSDPRPDAFIGDNAIYDQYWGAGIQEIPIPGPINTMNIFRFAGSDLIAVAPRHRVLTDAAGGWVEGFTSFSTSISGSYFTAFGNTGVVGATSLVLTNADGSISNLFFVPTNIFRQAIAVGVRDTNFTVRARFGPPSPIGGLGFGVTAVEIASGTTNVALGNPEQSTLYFIDYLGSDTNTLIVTNIGVWIPTGRPYAYEIYRDDPGFSSIGANGNTPLFTGFLYDNTFSNVMATNFYAGYRASIDSLQSRPAVVPGATVTNTPGRIEIVGDTVDLTRSRIRGMTTVEIKAGHLKSSSGAMIDVENLIYDLSSTNGLLTVQSLAKTATHQVRGDIRAWTGIWSNQFALVFSNWFIDANTNYFNPVTNPVDINLYCLILSADLLTRTQQVRTHSLALTSTNVVIDDPFVLNNKAAIRADGLTVNGVVTLVNPLRDWTQALTPGLRYFTNTGTINVPNVAYFGADYPAGSRLERFVNSGTLTAAAHEIVVGQYEDSGTVQTGNDLRLAADTVILDGAVHTVSGSAHYAGRDYKLSNMRLVAGQALFINATNSFTDSGEQAANYLDVQDGFHLIRKPAFGDLLGTTLITTAPRFASVAHTWAAEDRGAAPNGFKDNLAVGHLTLASQQEGELRLGPPTDGMGFPLPGSYGLYVDYLEFSTNRPSGAPSVADDPEGRVVIEPGLTVYFGYSNLDPEDLDGRFEGRLRWVKDYAGPASGVDVALRDGRTLRVNLGLVQSKEIDSDGDGLVNGLDVFPFDDLLITDFRIVSVNPYVTELSWRAAANTAYEVAYSTDLLAANWQVFATATNPQSSVQILSVRDSVPAGSSAAGGSGRFYRVSYEP